MAVPTQNKISIPALLSVVTAGLGVYATYAYVIPWIERTRQEAADARQQLEAKDAEIRSLKARAAEQPQTTEEKQRGQVKWIADDPLDRGEQERQRRRDEALARNREQALAEAQVKQFTDDGEPQPKKPVDPEVAAANKLRLARALFDIAKEREWLREIIRDYPGTKAAESAKKDLERRERGDFSTKLTQ